MRENTTTVVHSSKKSQILVVDDDLALRQLVRDFLTSEGYDVLESADSQSMRRKLAENDVQIIILDVMMPGESGISIARSLASEPDIGIIMVSALGGEADRISGLEAGADDYLPKPVSPRELLAHIRAFERRRHARMAIKAKVQFEFSGWKLDPVRRILRDANNITISLSEGEFRLLLALVEHAGTILSRERLLELSQAGEIDAFDRAVDTQISRLRSKLTTRGCGQFIRTVRNEGYIFVPSVNHI